MSPPGKRLELAVPIDTDVDAAARFYQQAFELDEPSRRSDGGWELRLGRMSLRVCSSSSCQDPSYRKGTVPRLELRVNDVDAGVARCVELGSSIRCRLAQGVVAAEGRAADYAQIVDPFGHLWSFAQEAPSESQGSTSGPR